MPARGFEGSAWRHVAVGRPALAGEGARLVGGRWNPPGSFAVFYLGTSRETVVAEFHRLARRQRVAPEQFLPRTLYRYALTLNAVVDLTDPEALEHLELSEEDLARDNLSVPQAIGAAAFASGREGILAPSATGRDRVVAVFVERLAFNSFVRGRGHGVGTKRARR
ncbi:MAG: RES domain-containing protein [Solirubrobacteraceae bacterium]